MMNRNLSITVIALVAFSIAGSGPTLAAPKGVCITTHVSAPFRLPDGVLHPAGSLTLCDTAAFTPVSDLHLLLVDGRSVGMFLSRRRTTEASGEIRPEVVFERGARGSLDLIGYILPTSGRSVAYRLKNHDDSWSDRDRAAQGAASAALVATTIAVGMR